MHKDNGVDKVEIASEKMRQFIIELAKLEATPKRFLNDMFTFWMQFIKDPKSIPPEFFKISEVKEAMDALQYMSADSELRAELSARIHELNDIRAGQTVKFKEGIAKGREEGEKLAKIEAAKKCYQTV